jgi:transketolase
MKNFKRDPSQMATRKDLANAIRALAMDAVQKANSGHPGMPMGMAEIAEVLWNGHLRFNPADPKWPERDRFVLSNGHGSMLLYALLHLTGYDLPMAEIENFRQLHSKTPGHPEYQITPGVETTTGPLGQGFANAVGMAIAERMLAGQFNRPGCEIVDHRTYVFMGDGCMMEGVSHEAAALAGTLKLGKLIAFYDDNGISIDSEKSTIGNWFTDDTPKRFEAYHWHVIRAVDGHDCDAIERAIQEAHEVADRPVLICCKTIIGKGAPNKANTGAAHGAALGEKEVAATRENIGWHYPPFHIPEDVYAGWDARGRGKALQAEWQRRFDQYQQQFPELAAEYQRRVTGALPSDWAARTAAVMNAVADKRETIATRKASQNAIEALAPGLPELVGGSADLAASNLTLWSGSKPFSRDTGGNYIFYGVREFGMAAIMNGLTVHGGIIPYGGTFLTFSDYARNALRMAALMKVRNIFVFTHDSIGLGEDGPTHQAVEHAATLRYIPNMDVWRPCDTTETAAAWIAAIERRDGPTSLLLSRQNLPFVERSPAQIADIGRGGYVIAEAAGGQVQAVLIATGSEVGLAIETQKLLGAKGVSVRVVSMPSTNVFDRQPDAYRSAVLPPKVKRVAVEAGVTDFWRKYVGLDGAVLGIDRFGESAPGSELFKFFGFTPDNLGALVTRVLQA